MNNTLAVATSRLMFFKQLIFNVLLMMKENGQPNFKFICHIDMKISEMFALANSQLSFNNSL